MGAGDIHAPSMRTVRVAGRLSIAFLLDVIDLGRGDRALIDGLLLIGIVQANVSLVTREPDLQRTYAAYDTPPPDALRRAVSVSAIANSLRLPYETVRRRVAGLERKGLCVVDERGVYVPNRVLTSPEHMAGSFAVFERLRQLYYRLKDLGVLRSFPEADPQPPVDLVRAIMRVFGDYFLRTVDAVSRGVGDLMAGLVLLGVLTANTEHLPDHEAGADGAEAEAFVPDSLRRPVSVAALARRLRLPEETVRRHASQLVADGRCARAPQGYLIPGAVLARPLWVALMGENLSHLNRMFSDLAHLGVLAAWDAARAAAAPVATA
jgi:DNA-binding Lrp family transcriptional regulator